jgi:DNA-binding MarR family transcriptional regulator
VPINCGSYDQRSLIIRRRLQNMADWAEKRREFLSQCSEHSWNPNWYIRIGGNGFTAVSVHNRFPLLGFTERGGSLNDLEEIKRQFGDPRKDPSENPRMKKAGKRVPERRMQAWLIKQALSKNGDFTSSLGLKPPRFEKLIFALDEVSLGDKDHKPINRCDILAVGTRGEKAFLVIIELKSHRDFNKLLDQLGAFKKEVAAFQKDFERLLSKCVGYQVSCEEADIGKIMIWPKIANDSRGRIQACWESGVDVIEYSWDHDDTDESIESIEFHPHLIHQTGIQ